MSQKKIPIEERSVRRANLQKVLGKALQMEGELKPSYASEDWIHEMWHSNTLKYMEWSRLTTRNQEVRKEKADPFFKKDSAGYLKEHAGTFEGTAVLNSDLRARNALQRRGMLLHMDNLVDYFTHDTLVRVLMNAYMADAPPDHKPLRIEQIQRADQEFWRILCDKCESGIRVLSNGSRPLEAAWEDALKATSFNLLLVHNEQGQNVTTPAGTSAGSSSDQSLKRRINDLENTIKQLRQSKSRPAPNNWLTSAWQGGYNQRQWQPQDQSQSRGNQQGNGGTGGGKNSKNKGTGKGKGGKTKDKSGKPSPRGQSLPLELIGGTSTTGAGDPICFDHNMAHGCKGALPGQRCPFGVHVCCFPGCESTEHTFANH